MNNPTLSRRNLFKYGAIIGGAVVTSGLLAKGNEMQQAFNPSNTVEIGSYDKEVLIKGKLIKLSVDESNESAVVVHPMPKPSFLPSIKLNYDLGQTPKYPYKALPLETDFSGVDY